ncbi:BamA/TamA family outer membrane protein [candidate division KSB1 bacterium]|nr:BamA/TamA family outer membrane protein [candidate division KSB1 bacterium]
MKTYDHYRIQICAILLFVILLSHRSGVAQFKSPTISNTTFLEFEDRSFQYYPLFRYNRVEGLFIGTGLQQTINPIMKITAIGELGYGFSNKETRYKVGFYKNLFEFNKLRLGLNYFYDTASKDDWLLSEVENTIAAALFKYDYMDYYLEKGYKFYANQFLSQQAMQIRLEIIHSSYDIMERSTNWALFRKESDFHSNPAIAPGDETRYRICMTFDTRDNPIHPRSGVKMDGIYEITEGDFETEGVFISMRSYQPVGRRPQIQTRLLIGARNGSTAEQYLLDLGGIGTLPGFDDKEFRHGNRLMLYNFRYLFNGALLEKLPFSFIPFYDALGLALFFNTGWLRFEDSGNEIGAFPGFEKIKFNQLKTDVGFSFSVADDFFLVDIAKRTDRAEHAWRVSARLLYRL